MNIMGIPTSVNSIDVQPRSLSLSHGMIIDP